jgi:hypothetical protein
MNHGAMLHFGVPPEAFDGNFMVLAQDRTTEELSIDEETNPVEIQLPKNGRLIPSSPELERVEAVLAAKHCFYDSRRILIDPIARLRRKYHHFS